MVPIVGVRPYIVIMAMFNRATSKVCIHKPVISGVTSFLLLFWGLEAKMFKSHWFRWTLLKGSHSSPRSPNCWMVNFNISRIQFMGFFNVCDLFCTVNWELFLVNCQVELNLKSSIGFNRKWKDLYRIKQTLLEQIDGCSCWKKTLNASWTQG